MTNPRLLSVATAVPPHRYEQEEAKRWARATFADGLGDDLERLLSIYDNAGVRTRHVAVELDWFSEEHSFAEKNQMAVEKVLEISVEAAGKALDKAGARPEEISDVVFVTNSAISVPSLDYRLVFQLGLPVEVRRVPIWGRGCAGGAVGLSLAADLARARGERAALAGGPPEGKTLLVVAEVCSLTYVRGDQSRANFLSGALFADGAAAVVLDGSEGPDEGEPRILSSFSTTWPDTEDIMGFSLMDAGLKVDLSPRAPVVVRRKMPAVLKHACADLGLTPEDLVHLAVHPGGPRIVESFVEALDVEPERLALSREILAEYGNMSSATVLFILQRLLERTEPAAEEARRKPGVVAAMGPGFSAELVLFDY